MLKPDYATFETQCRSGNLIPVCCDRLADTETPVSVLARLMDEPNLFLLESCEQGRRFGRYSFIGINPYAIFSVEGGIPYLTREGVKTALPFEGSPFLALKNLLSDIRPVASPDLPPLFGGAIGYIGYETITEFEELPPPKEALEDPSAFFLLTDEMMAFDNIRHTLTFIVCARPENFPTPRAAYDDAAARLTALQKKLRAPVELPPAPAMAMPELKSNLSEEAFCEMVRRGQQAIRDGECIQIVLSRKFTTTLPTPPIHLYRALRHVNPSPYTFLLKNADRVLIGSSPETMVKLESGKTALRPIAGTRPRGKTQAEDRAFADELLRDEKERAEHLMLVDLGRNDLGRTAVPGSVQVNNFMHVERYSHVMHLVSDVEAILATDKDAFDLVRTTFPAGTLSGAPKIRAMELIRELEPEPRGIYGGAMGYFSYTGNLDLAITIRTLILHGDRLTVQAGAGIVHDSIPEKEYAETTNKAAALVSAIRFCCNEAAY